MKIAIITGASSGMGRLFAIYAKHFYKDIDEIWLISRNLKKLTSLSLKLNVSSSLFAIDLTKDNELELLKNTLQSKKPEIRLLVNSAGMGIIGEFEAINEDDIHDMISINVESLTKVTRICLDYMGRGSCIINLASSAAFIPQSEFAVYAATKSYVLSFSDALYKELKKDKIHVLAVCPGCVNTPFFQVAQKYTSIKSYKKFFMAKDKDVVIDAYIDAKYKKIHSIYGIWMKLFYLACKFLPEKFIMLFM